MAKRDAISSCSVTLRGLLVEMRPWQWYKQAVLLLGIVFSKQLFQVTAWTQVIPAIVSFCLVSSAIYIINDISDIEQDREHPEKRHRPLASGQMRISTAFTFALGLLTAAFILAWAVSPSVAMVAGGYVSISLGYSLGLKAYTHVDILIIAIGFVLRAVAGVVAIAAKLSPWLVVCTFLVALMFAIGKRKYEATESDNPGDFRNSLNKYSAQELNHLFIITATSVLLSYTLYTFFGADDMMIATLPFAYFAVFRYHHFVLSGKPKARLRHLLLDRTFVANFVIWISLVIVILYEIPSLVVDSVMT